MDTRKLINFGKNSYIVSLPKSWLSMNKLGKGDTIYIDDSSLSELRIMPGERSQKPEPKKIVISTDRKTLSEIRNEIVSAYLLNYEIIELIGDNIPENQQSIKNFIRDLSGMEIMEITSRRITANGILNEEQVDLANIFRRIDMTVRSMITDSIATLDEDLASSIEARDSDVNRLVFLAFRVVRKAMSEPQFGRFLKMSNTDLLNFWTTLSSLESIADQAKRASRHISKLGGSAKGNEKLRLLFISIEEIYLETMKAHYKNDRQEALKLIGKSKELNLKCDEMLAGKQSVAMASTIGFLKSMISSIKQIARTILIYT